MSRTETAGFVHPSEVIADLGSVDRYRFSLTRAVLTALAAPEQVWASMALFKTNDAIAALRDGTSSYAACLANAATREAGCEMAFPAQAVSL
jgi:hypothetical protein